jgi:outer membrane lipoprotein LolB
LRWHQQGTQASIDLSAPLGFGAAHIEQDAGLLQLTTSKGLKLDSEAAGEELRASVGFDPPLASLRYWILGVSDPASVPEQTVLDAQQRLSVLQQDGWRVEYTAYSRVQALWLPQRLTLTRDALRLRVVVEDWKL